MSDAVIYDYILKKVRLDDKAQFNTSNVSNPPTSSELSTIFGTPASIGVKTYYINDNGAGDNFYQVVSDGTNWWIFTATKAS